MQEQSRRWAAVGGVAALVGLSLVLVTAPPAEALACPPMSSLCNPVGLAVLAAGEEGVAATTATAIAGTAASAATLGGASISAGAYGSAVAAAVGGAAVVGISAWAADQFVGGSSVAWAGAGIAPGWLNGVDSAPTAGSSQAMGSAWLSGSIRWEIVRAPAYNTVGPLTILTTYVGSCSSGATWPAVYTLPVMLYADGTIWQMGNAAITSCSSPTSTQTYTGSKGFGGFIARVGSGLVNGGAPVTWYAPGSPSYPPGSSAATGVMTKSIECTDVSGTVLHAEASWTGTLGAGQPSSMPEVACPSGSVITGFGETWTPAGGGAVTVVVPWTETPPWVRSIPAEYPACLTADCHLDLRKIQPGGVPATTCGFNAVACPDWYSDPARADDYECRWGEYLVPLVTCSTFRRPGTTMPNTTTKTETLPDGSTRTVPTTEIVTTFPDAADDPVGDPGPSGQPGGESSDCFPSGFGIFNPIEWVLKPVGCALSWAFVPSAVTSTAWQDFVGTTSVRPPVNVAVGGIGFVNSAVAGLNGSGDCTTVGLEMGNTAQVTGSFDLCAAVTEAGSTTWGQRLRQALTLVIVGGACWIAYHRIASSFGGKA